MNNDAVNQHLISFRFTLKMHVVRIYIAFLSTSVFCCVYLCLQLLSSLLSRRIYCNLSMLKSINMFKYIAHIVENMHCCYFFSEGRKLYNRHVSCKKKLPYQAVCQSS